MDVRTQMQDVNQERTEVATGSQCLEVEEHGVDLSRNSSLTTVCSTFPLTSRIESYHSWQSMDGERGDKDLNRELDIESEQKVQLAISMSMPLALGALHP